MRGNRVAIIAVVTAAAVAAAVADAAQRDVSMLPSGRKSVERNPI